MEEKDKAGETPPHLKMVRVVNTHGFKSFHLGDGRKIGPGQHGKVPIGVYNKVKDTMVWLKRAERGDVI
jgi:hypothetical protein